MDHGGKNEHHIHQKGIMHRTLTVTRGSNRSSAKDEDILNIGCKMITSPRNTRS